MQQHSFPSGSRQAPDPYDQFLEQNGFYRKHTARDASSLFRVISEQMYDTQMHHPSIRKRCVNFMQKHRIFFQKLVERDFDDYLEEMSKPKTCATLIELQAVGLLYKRNVFLFGPFNLGNIFGHHREYFDEVFRVFCTPEKHFDSVYTIDFIKNAAICQSLCYELLYKDLFKIPDVNYAVELMLHNASTAQELRISEPSEDAYAPIIEYNDQRSFPLDLPSETNCILEDSSLCRFHSSHKQEEIEYDIVEECEGKQAKEYLLPNKHISCVRQLLMEGITPFPYKVAKALDPTMYRNIEFDAWNEARKEMKFQNWYSGDGNFKVGAKCHVKLSKAENEPYICHIQDISVDKTHCLVFIEQLGEKRLVPYEALSPLPVELFKPWALPYRFNRQMQKYHSMRLTRHYNSRCKFNGQSSGAAMQSYYKNLSGPLPAICNSGSKGGGACIGASFSLDFGELKQHQQHYMHLAAAGPGGQQHFHNSCLYNLTHLENFRARTFEYCTMPFTVEHSVNTKSVAAPQHNQDTHGDDNGGGSCGVTTTVQSETSVNENLDESSSNQVGTSGTVDNGGPQDECGGNEIALINHNYAAEQMTYAAEYPAYHAMPPAGFVAEDYYSFGCDPGYVTQYSNGGGMYYMYNHGTPTAPAYSHVGNNYYMPGPAVPAPPSVLISSAPMAQPQYYSASNAYYTNSAPNMLPTPLLSQVATVAHAIQEANGNAGVSLSTPLSGRINYEAKKSIKHNGMDLPSDMPTLRYFYNLGVETHNRRRQSQDSTAGIRDNVSIKEERVDEQRESNANKADANNNNIATASNPKNYSNNAASQANGASSKPPYGTRRYHNSHNNRYNNNPRDRAPQRRNSTNVDEPNSSSSSSILPHSNGTSYTQRNYQEYTKNKHSNQNTNANERYGGEAVRQNGGHNLSMMNRHQAQRHNERGSYHENGGPHNSAQASGGGDGLTDAGKGGENGTDNGQLYPSYGPLYPSYESVNDYNPSKPPNGNGVGPVAAPGNMFIPVHVQPPPNPYGAMYAASAPNGGAIFQPMNQTASSYNPNYGPPQFIGHPQSPLMQNGFVGGPINGAAAAAPNMYIPSNPLSSNVSESSIGGGGNGNGDGAIVAPPSLHPNLMGNGYGPSIPIYVAPSQINGNSNGQPLMHHPMSQPPPPPQPSAAHMHGGGSQGFWCLPPPHPPTGPASIPSSPAQMPHLPNVGFVGPTSSLANNNTNHTQVSPVAPSSNNNTGGAQNRRTPAQQQQQQQQKPLQQQQQNDKEKHNNN